MRQDHSTIHDNFMQNLRRLTSQANSSCLVNCRTLKYYLRLIIFHYLAYITAIERFTVYFLCLVCSFHVTMEMYRALHGADDFGTRVPDSRGHSPGRGLVLPAP